MVSPQIRLELVYEDSDLLELDVRATNGLFAGSGRYYVGIDFLDELRAVIAGFPIDAADLREATIGTLEDGYARGGIRLQFSCVGFTGRAHLVVEMLTHNESGAPTDTSMSDQRVSLWSAVEPAAIDSFVAELGAVMRRERTVATLSLMCS